MVGMRILGAASGSRSQSSEKAPGSSVLEIHFWMPSRIQAISPLVDRLMLLIEGSQCIRGEEPDVELALREALADKDNEIRCEHLILGIVRGGDKAAIGLITEHVYTAQLRAAVVRLLDKAA